MPKPNERGKPRGVIFMFNCPCGIEHRIDIEKAGLKMLFIDTCKGRKPNMALVKHYMREPIRKKEKDEWTANPNIMMPEFRDKWLKENGFASLADYNKKMIEKRVQDRGVSLSQPEITQDAKPFYSEIIEKKSGSPGTPSQKNQGAGGNETGNETL